MQEPGIIIPYITIAELHETHGDGVVDALSDMIKEEIKDYVKSL